MSEFPESVPALEIVATHEDCPVPVRESFYNPPDRPYGSLWRCPECHQWWRVGHRYKSDHSGRKWRTVTRFGPTWFKCKWYEWGQR